MALKPESLGREPLHESVHDPVHKPLPNFGSMSEAELLAYVSQDESDDKFAVPAHLPPDGMTYAWVRAEVLGKPDAAHLSQMEQRHWRAVPQERHDGRWMARGTKGPTILDGLMLMELPTPLYNAKQAWGQRQARGAVTDLEQQMIYNPPGTGPRDQSPKTRPNIRKEVVNVQMNVE